MKTSITAIALALASGPALADGFYQQVTNQLNPPAQQEIAGDPEFRYTPLYIQVVGDGRRSVDLEQTGFSSGTRFTYTPLYAAVTGNRS